MRLVTKVTLSEMWYNPTLRQPLIIAVMVMLSQQFSGINAAISFSTDIFKSAGLSDNAALYSTMGKLFERLLGRPVNQPTSLLLTELQA